MLKVMVWLARLGLGVLVWVGVREGVKVGVGVGVRVEVN